MGLFIKNHTNYDDLPVKQSQSSQLQSAQVNGNDYASLGMSAVNSIFGLLTNISDGKGGTEDDKGNDSETRNKIDAKKQELKNLYSVNGIKNEKDLYKKVKKQSDKVKNLSSEVITLSASLQTINQRLSSLNTQYNNVTTQINELKKTESTKADDMNYINQLSILKEQLREIESQIQGVKNESSEKIAQLDKKQNELNIEQTEFAKLAGIAAQAENLENEILQLKGKSLTHNVNYNVEQETKDLSRFNTALKSFPKTGATQEDAENLINAFNNSDSENKETMVNQKNAIVAMRLIKQANPKLDWSKLNIS